MLHISQIYGEADFSGCRKDVLWFYRLEVEDGCDLLLPDPDIPSSPGGRLHRDCVGLI